MLAAALAITALSMWGCQSKPMEPITTSEYVDLERFMGDWYVIAHIPIFMEKGAYQAVESYSLNQAGHIDTQFTFNEGGFDGERKSYNPKRFVVEDDTSNAVWKMQFLWPFKADYRIVYVDDQYQQTIVGREARDYVWVMARTPKLDDAEYDRLIQMVADEGYDLSGLRKVPQRG